MNEISTATRQQAPSVFVDAGAFEAGWRMAEALARSKMIPVEYQGKPENTLIAIEVAQRTGASPLAVMQNLYIVHGKPGWSAQYIIAAINASGKYSPLRFAITGDGDEKTCVAWATDKTGERLDSPPVSIKMAKDEGWFNKNGSKWKTMPELMLRYRAATLFGRLYAPEILMGMKTADEIDDIAEPKRMGPAQVVQPDQITGEMPTFNLDAEKDAAANCESVDQLREFLRGALLRATNARDKNGGAAIKAHVLQLVDVFKNATVVDVPVKSVDPMGEHADFVEDME